MKFKVHTTSGVYEVEAKKPDDARKQFERDGIHVTKVKLAGGQKKTKVKQP